MVEEYILKLGDEVKIIQKDQWDGNIDSYTFRFIVIGPGIYRNESINGDNTKIEKEYPARIGIIFQLKEKDKGNLIALYEYEKGKYSYKWIRIIKEALKYEVAFILKTKEIFEAMIWAIMTEDSDIEYKELSKIIKSIVLGKVLYEELLDYNVRPLFDVKQYYYILYKYILEGNLNYKTYLEIIDLKDVLIELDADYIFDLKRRYERIYEKMRNNS
jgi:hypothetical protein